MGEIRADVALENTGDRDHFQRGHGRESEIRRSTVDAVVDTGAVALVLPQNVVERPGLKERARRSSPAPANAGRNGRWRVR